MLTYAKPEGKQEPKDAVQRKAAESAAPPNVTGIPGFMKSRLENLSGFSFNDVRVHYNSGKPKHLQALAYTQGNQVYIGPGQEKHLEHELGHVVQQKRGIVKPNVRVNGVAVNNDPVLEKGADHIHKQRVPLYTADDPSSDPVQRKLFIADQEYTDKGVGDEPEIQQNNILYIPNLKEKQLKKALTIAIFPKEYRFGSAEEFKAWIEKSVNVEELAKTIHAALHAHIKTLFNDIVDNKTGVDVGASGTFIGEDTLSTTGILIDPDEKKIQIASNFAKEKKIAGSSAWKTEGYVITMPMIEVALNGRVYDSENILENYTVTLLTQTGIAISPYEAPHRVKAEIPTEEEVKAENKASAKNKAQEILIPLIQKALLGEDGDNWKSFSMHADAMLIHSTDKANPLTGISKEPCELCEYSGVPGRKTGKTGLKGVFTISVSNSAMAKIGEIVNDGSKEEKETAGQNIIIELLDELYNKRAIYITKGKAMNVKLPKWIPPRWMRWMTTNR